jgi:hypothetical protein
MKEIRRPKVLTRNDFFSIEECDCGKHPFRYHNTSKNEFVLKCSITKDEYDIKLKKWVVNKKQPCDLFCIYYAERPVFQQINTILKKACVVKVDKDVALEEKLRLLFRFVFVSNHTSTLDEINILVKNNLKRESRKVYYYPSIGHMRISHYETLQDYHNRIFSKKIVDLNYFLPPIIKAPTCISRLNENKSNKKIPVKSKNNFIVVTDDEAESELGESDSERESDSDRELSDYSEAEETEIEEIDNVEEIEEIEDIEDIEEYNDESGGEDYYD